MNNYQPEQPSSRGLLLQVLVSAVVSGATNALVRYVLETLLS